MKQEKQKTKHHPQKISGRAVERGFHVQIPTQHGVEVTQDASWLHSERMDISNALNVDSMVLQEILNLIRFCQNSYCITENKNTSKNQRSLFFNCF